MPRPVTHRNDIAHFKYAISNACGEIEIAVLDVINSNFSTIVVLQRRQSGTLQYRAG